MELGAMSLDVAELIVFPDVFVIWSHLEAPPRREGEVRHCVRRDLAKVVDVDRPEEFWIRRDFASGSDIPAAGLASGMMSQPVQRQAIERPDSDNRERIDLPRRHSSLGTNPSLIIGQHLYLPSARQPPST
jgi:hypothetical protein